MSSQTESRLPSEAETNQSTRGPQLEVSKIHELPSEQQDLALLTFVSELRNYAFSLSVDDLPARQPDIKREVIKVVGLGVPVSSRVVRQGLGQILANIFGRGSRQLLHETVAELNSILASGKSDKDIPTKHTAATCLGSIFQAAGDSAVSLAGLVVGSLLKAFKSAANHVGFRVSIIRALGQLVEGLGTSMDETFARDIAKQARSCAGADKAALVQKAACKTIRSLLEQTPYFANSTDFDNFKSTMWKVMDSNLFVTRKAAAATLARALVGAYSENGSNDAIPVLRKPKKSKKTEQDAEDVEDDVRVETATPVKQPMQLLLSLNDMLRVLSSQYCRASVSNRARSGLAVCYRMVLEGLPEKVVRDQYPVIANHFCSELVDHAVITNNRYRLLLTRKYVHTLLSKVVSGIILSENGQINAARWIIIDVLKNYPKVIPERPEPSKRVLATVLRALSYLLDKLGPACASFQDSCRDALFQVLHHPSYTVQVHAAFCFRIFVRSCPQQLTRCVEQAIALVRKDLDQATDGRAYRRAVGTATSVAAMIATARHNPLYGSVELFASCFSFATDSLKASSNSELRLCAAQVQVAWILIGGLMALGPSFAKVHLNQLLLLWRNASPLPLTQDNSSKRSQLELSFLTHVRESALTALLTFLIYNSSLVTLDGSKRISTVLSNSVSFLESLPDSRQTDDISNRLVPTMQLQDYSSMLRRRLLQCLTRLMGLRSVDHNEIASQADITGLAVRTLISPERPTQKNLEASLASSASTFESLWELGDNWAFGISSLVEPHRVFLPSQGDVKAIELRESTHDPIDADFEGGAAMPIVPAIEHDPALACGFHNYNEMVDLPPAETVCTTAAVQVFAVTLPLQPPRIQEGCIEQLTSALAQPMHRDPGRKAALQLNIAVALLSTLAVANKDTSFSPGKLSMQTVGKGIAEVLRSFLGEPDEKLRSTAALGLARLCNLAGTQFTSNQVKILVNTIVAVRDPNARAGCALALGELHSGVGAMAASYHLKDIVGILLSLCSDSHPTVHYWALRGLANVAESAGLTFASYAASTLGLLAQLYTMDTHNEESSLIATSNANLLRSSPLALAKCLDSIINVLGPDLQDSTKMRNLILTLVRYFKLENWALLRVQSFICLGHILMYAPAHIQLTEYVHDLQHALSSKDLLLQDVAIVGIENLVKRSASEVVRVSSTTFGDEVWARLDKDPRSPRVRNILRSWMQQTCLNEVAEWIRRCQSVLSKTRITQDAKGPATTAQSAPPDLADEDVAGLTAAAAVPHADQPDVRSEGQEFLRWQTRDFALQLMSDVLNIVQHEIHPDRVVPAEAVLQRKVSDVVRVAFVASTANVSALRVWGMRILDQILRMFGRTPDPDFLEASLLEQYQAQISSALTPAFSADSTPEIAAVAIEVCATFVATGIVTNVDRMGRIFKVLSASLEQLTQSASGAGVGELKDLSENAQAMLKMSLLSGWAQLQLASNEQSYLEAIMHPYVPKLAPLWLSSLQEFAALRFEPEISNTLGGEFASSLSDRYAAWNREVRLKFYQSSWLNLVDAIALLVEKDSNAVFDALDNKHRPANGADTNGVVVGTKNMSFREEPVAFFFILYGLAYEALVTHARDSPTESLAILNALRRILRPAVSGSAIYQDVVFTETTDTLDRLALTSDSETQAVLVEIAKNLSKDHMIAKASDRDEKLAEDIDQLFELTRIIVLILIGILPTLEDPPGTAVRGLDDASINLIQHCFQALVDVADVFPSVIRADLHACVVHSYCAILATGVCQPTVVPRLLPVFRSFLQKIATSSGDEVTSRLVRGCLAKMLVVLSIAQRRENEYALSCAKNTLLSMTVLLSTAGIAIPGNDDLPRKAVLELLDCLSDVGLAKIAAGCVRTLLMTNPKSASDESIARLLWPVLVVFVHDTSADDPELVRSAIVHALTSSVATLRGDGRLAAMSIMVPSLLTRARQVQTKRVPEELGHESATRLLELAAADGLAFRSTVTALTDDQRQCLEVLLRSTNAGRPENSDGTEVDSMKPAIALRMDFD